jgi:hypothetical protein
MKKVIDVIKYAEKLFSKNEIKELRISGYKYEKTNKITVKIPLKFTDKLAFEMSQAGGGVIGNYELCSFRINGIGTFKPSSKANPFTGNKNKINFVEEIKMEMRCSNENLDAVIDAIYNHHPYEEPDYDITEIKFRSKTPESVLVKLKKSLPAIELLKRINKNINISQEDFSGRKKVSALLITNDNENTTLNADAVIFADRTLKLKLN